MQALRGGIKMKAYTYRKRRLDCIHLWKLTFWKKYKCIKCGKITTMDQHIWVPKEDRYLEE
jgi:hypothetical protein